MRLALSVLAVLTGFACAHVEPPPGGPEDRRAPTLFGTRPDTGAVVPGYSGPVVLLFDERISEQNLEESVMVSPRTSPVAVSHGRDEIRVELRRGWDPGVIYHVTVGDNIRDLFGNRIADPITVVFSTGPAIPATLVRGTVSDRVTGQLPENVRIEAVRAADSLVYAVPPDSAGGFEISRFPEGDYQLRAFEDINRNRALDSFEARDSASISVTAGQAVEEVLQLIEPDSTAPALERATLRDGFIRIETDDYLDPEQTLTPEQFGVDGPGGAVAIVSVFLGEAVAADSAGAAAPGAAGPGNLPAGRPVNFIELELEDPAGLQEGAEYEITASGLVNLVGLTGGGSTTLEVPEAPPAPVTAPAGGAGP